MNKVLVVAPHPDDETLGCGGTLLRHRKQGDDIFWLVVTGMTEDSGYPRERQKARQKEIQKVSRLYGFNKVFQTSLPTTRLDAIPRSRTVEAMRKVLDEVRPDFLYLPFRGDVHSDHKIVFDAAISCSKTFRAPYLRKVLCYETLSETDFNLDPKEESFRPNLFVDISKHLDKKIEIMKVYSGETAPFPFPRSGKAIRALAQRRGAISGCHAAEAFVILKEINN